MITAIPGAQLITYSIKDLAFFTLIHLLLVSFFLYVPLAQGQENKETKHVLLLITGQKDVPGYKLSEEGVKEGLGVSEKYQFEYYVEYMDMHRFHDAAYLKDLLDLYRTKYAGNELDLVIALGYHALELACRNKDSIFNNAPVVFSTVLEKQLQQLNIDETYTGSIFELDYLNVLETALGNHPGTEQVVIISGQGKVGQLLHAEIRNAYSAHEDRYDFLYFNNLGMEDILGQLRDLPDTSIVLYFYLAVDGEGTTYKPWEVASMVSETASVPTYGVFDTYVGQGVVGGAVTSFGALGRSAGTLGLKVVNGENPVDIPITSVGGARYIFDWRQLERWQIDERDLPPGSEVLFKELSLVSLYGPYIAMFVLFAIFQLFIIAALFRSRIRYKNKEQQLKASEDRYKGFIQHSFDGIWCLSFTQPLSLDLPEEEQFECFFKYAYLVEANDAYARSVGLTHGKDLEGKMLSEFMQPTDPQNIATIKALIQNNYMIEGAESIEDFGIGGRRNIVNNAVGVIKAGHVVRIWGTGTDVTSLRKTQHSLSKSKEFTLAILNSIEDHIVVLDKTGEILTVNNRWMQFSRENGGTLDVVGRGVNYFDVCRKAIGSAETIEEQTSVTEILDGLIAIAEGDASYYSIEYACLTPKEKRWFQLIALPLKGEKGSLVVSHRDITARKKMRFDLIEAKRKYRTVADFTYDWEYWEASDGKVLYMSPSCERISGYSVEEFTEQPQKLFEIILPKDQHIWNKHEHGKAMRQHRCTFRIRRKDGEIRWVSHVCQPVFDASDNFEGVRVSNRDITELRTVEQKERDVRNALEHLERKESLGLLVGSIAHELNQPLTGILSDAQAGELLLAKKGLDKSLIREIFEDIVTDTKRASLVIRNLRALFTKGTFESTPVDVNILIQETLEIFKYEIINVGVVVHTTLAKDIPIVNANKIQIQQVLINLIKNALQAMQHDDGRKRHLHIRTVSSSDSPLTVCVEDNGPGIQPDQLQEIFRSLTTAKEGGMGMGLAICKSIIQAHEGRIWAENISESSGTRLKFTLSTKR